MFKLCGFFVFFAELAKIVVGKILRAVRNKEMQPKIIFAETFNTQY